MGSACGGSVASGPGSPATGSPAPSPSSTPCAALPSAVGPDVAGSLGNSDDGSTFCIHVGDRLNVFLSVPPDQADSGWTAIALSDGTVLSHEPSGVLTLVRGVTAGIFKAVKAGSTHLSSTKPPCAPTSSASACPAGDGWQVTITVQA